MLFTSPVFLFIFLPITFFGFLLARQLKHPAPVPAWLLAASMIFYAWWSPIFLILLVGSTLVELAVRAWHHGNPRRALQSDFLSAVWCGTSGCSPISNTRLFHLKFQCRLWRACTAAAYYSAARHFFFTFQKIAYLADIHAGHAKPGRLLDFALFVFFFPQLIAGPIVHHAEVMPQFRAIAQGEKTESVSDAFAAGLTLLLIGLAKKIGVADQVASLLSTPVYEAAASGKTIGLILAWQALAYTVQLYFDFSRL